ncbi:hypothetical protein GA0070624_3256 [Micromonospora rhizosphaerae]|uniref:Uncharacterized protein n=1 Tax=Micromonospora rhizosphaerae TaxID=568872 RepID=A0A1C6SA84_9ACTN|nr:hypothetical protein [Micromonospora rhizosphaerae]SCL26192.1 hypothetical protein GA0070624_3256 [Micromonospora rhizosphaerae]
MPGIMPARRTVEVDADVYDVLERTAASRNTDINGALRYLIEVPKIPAARPATDDEE